jgi:hypothetical protein
MAGIDELETPMNAIASTPRRALIVIVSDFFDNRVNAACSHC